MFEFEEYKSVKHQISGWIMIFAFSAMLIGWCFFFHMMIPDSQPQWDFGQIDDIPASSKYSTHLRPDDINLPLQIAPPIIEQKSFKK